jgi:hypothetical protein
MRIVCLLIALTAWPGLAQVVVDTPMAPPSWALMEQELLRANSAACERFYEKYVDSRGYLLHTPRWGTLDGPDDAVETFYNWTLLHALGGSDSMLDMWKKAYEGHLLQYSEIRTVKTELAKNGAYFDEFITMSDWFHTGEGLRAFFLQGLSDPKDELLVKRMKRFSGLYMNEDPEAPNYDAEHKIIRSIWTGSYGPMLRRATVYDWVGDAVPGRFHLLHNPARGNAMLSLEAWYPRMLAHCTEYLDSEGDQFLNLGATLLHTNAFMLTGEEKYRDWVKEYVGAWRERTAANGGMVPSNIGLDGTLGGEHNGQWWKGTYGWNFTIFDGELQDVAHRNYFTAGTWPGFGNALLLTGDQGFVDVLRKQMDLIYAQKKVVDGKTLIPQMYGDPRGYKFNEREEWYHWTDRLHTDRLTEIYLWSMDRKDLERVPKEGWIGFLEGKDPDYPVKALQADFGRLRGRVQAMRDDPTTPGTRLADWPLRLTPAQTDTLTKLMLGGYFAGGKLWTLHSRVRYFDPERRRAGIPPDVGALVEKLEDDSMVLTLVNTNPVDSRDVIVQAGAYAEHRFTGVEINGKSAAGEGSWITVKLEPGCGAKLQLGMKRYAAAPTLTFPWDRAE